MLNKITLLLVLLITFALNLCADTISVDGNQYRRYVKSVDYSYEMKGIVVHLTLSDDTQATARLNYQWCNYGEIEKMLAIGNELFTYFSGRKLILYTPDFKTKFDMLTFYLNINSPAVYPQVINIEKVPLENSWFWEKEYYVYLSDNSIWKTTSRIPFVIGDRILVSLTKSSDKWCLSRPNDRVYENRYLFTPVNVSLIAE
ncbi:MAG: hypothetical protein WC222_06865 [Parachlamydiales bacterium]|jgi:hypothetical protein